MFGYALTIWPELKGEYFGKTGRDLALEDLGSVLNFAYSYTINSTEFRYKLRTSFDSIIWNRPIEEDPDNTDFHKTALGMKDELDSFREELFNKAAPAVD